MELFRRYYSVPYALVGEVVEIRYTALTVEILHKGKRVASHRRDDHPGQHTTLPPHMPKSHRKYLEWGPSRILEWAAKTGESTEKVVKKLLDSRQYPEQAYRSCLGILRMGKSFGKDRLEAACARAVAIHGESYKSIRSILEKGLDKIPLGEESKEPLPLFHQNIRGADYYQTKKEERSC